MSKQAKGGRLPLEDRDVQDQIDTQEAFDDLNYDLLKLDKALKKELADKGLVPRWINTKLYAENGNFHKQGWRPYKREPIEQKDVGSLDFNYGQSPEGYIKRNDLILAVKTNVEHKRFKDHQQKLTDIRSGVNKTRAQELREAAKERGVKGVKIHEGYEEND